MPRADRSARTAALALVVAAGLGLAACATPPDPAVTDRQRAVAEVGQDVMGFDLDATLHRFTPTATGGVEEVLARDPGDQDEIAAVRAHLQSESLRWARGDFSAPATIHGADMPGLAELQAAGERLTVDYVPVPGGARVTFTGADSAVVDALHDWFDAQVGDHGADAEHG